jgi:hypothetical protein
MYSDATVMQQDVLGCNRIYSDATEFSDATGRINDKDEGTNIVMSIMRGECRDAAIQARLIWYFD